MQLEIGYAKARLGSIKTSIRQPVASVDEVLAVVQIMCHYERRGSRAKKSEICTALSLENME